MCVCVCVRVSVSVSVRVSVSECPEVCVCLITTDTRVAVAYTTQNRSNTASVIYLHCVTGGRGGFGTVYFGGAGEISSRCLGGGAAGQTTWSGDCRLGSTRCPFCGAGGAPTRCSLCRHREGGRRGPWALARKVRIMHAHTRVPGEIERSRDLGGGRWSWTLKLAQKRS